MNIISRVNLEELKINYKKDFDQGLKTRQYPIYSQNSIQRLKVFFQDFYEEYFFQTNKKKITNKKLFLL